MKWFSIVARAGTSAAEIYIYDEVGAGGVAAIDFIQELKALGTPRELTLHINSPGGGVADGFAIYTALDRHPAKVNVTIDGVAASIASMIAMAGDHVEMPENALLMIHDPAGLVAGTSSDMRKTADVLDKMRLGMIRAYSSKSKLPDAKIINLMEAETWMTAQEAKDLGFADAVTGAVKIAAKFDLAAKYPNAPTGANIRYENTERAIRDLCALASLPEWRAERYIAAKVPYHALLTELSRKATNLPVNQTERSQSGQIISWDEISARHWNREVDGTRR